MYRARRYRKQRYRTKPYRKQRYRTNITITAVCLPLHLPVSLPVPVHSAVALSATSGQVLWRRPMRESVMFIQCGLQYQAHPVPLPAGGAALRAYPETAPLLVGQREQASGPVCLLITKKVLTAVNGTTGGRFCVSTMIHHCV